MNYSRIEVNLLPPELQPGPAVRYAMLINFAIIATAAIYLVFSLSTLLSRISNLTSQVKTTTVLVQGMQPIREQHEKLSKIDESVENYGRLVALASADYVAMPVLLERLSRVVPAGVIVESITNQGTRRRGDGTVIAINLRTATDNPSSMRQTVQNFKNDPMFADSYLRMGSIADQSLDDYLKTIDVTWTTSGPGVSDRIASENYTFEIVSTIPAGFEVEGLPVVFDQSRFYDVEFKVPPPPSPEDEKKNARRGRNSRDAEEGETPPAGSPAGAAGEAS